MLFITVPRISPIQQGRLAPLYGGTPRNLSPSPTLLVESHRAGPADSGTRLIPGQVLSLFLEPVGVRHSAEGFPSSRIGIPANSTVISMRGRTESVVWLGPAQILAVQVADSVMAAAASTLFDDEGFELTPNPGAQDARLSALLQVLRFEQASGFDSGRLFLDGIEQARRASGQPISSPRARAAPADRGPVAVLREARCRLHPQPSRRHAVARSARGLRWLQPCPFLARLP